MGVELERRTDEAAPLIAAGGAERGMNGGGAASGQQTRHIDKT